MNLNNNNINNDSNDNKNKNLIQNKTRKNKNCETSSRNMACQIVDIFQNYMSVNFFFLTSFPFKLLQNHRVIDRNLQGFTTIFKRKIAKIINTFFKSKKKKVQCYLILFEINK